MEAISSSRFADSLVYVATDRESWRDVEPGGCALLYACVGNSLKAYVTLS